jgi:hypothetical protein
MAGPDDGVRRGVNPALRSAETVGRPTCRAGTTLRENPDVRFLPAFLAREINMNSVWLRAIQ